MIVDLSRPLHTFLLAIVLLFSPIVVTGCSLAAEEDQGTASRAVTAAVTSHTPSPTDTPLATDTSHPTSTPLPTGTSLPTSTAPLPAAAGIPHYTYRIVNSYPHDRGAFTQGLVFARENGVDILYEGTGLNGRSSLRRVVLQTGEILQQYDLPEQYFGEGIATYGNEIVQLTWQSNVGFVYDKDTFALLEEFHYPTEGWGITHDGQRFIMSDGTATLHFLDLNTLEEIGRVEVRDENGPLTRLNELEYIEGEVYANVWQTDRIARISPQSGHVVGWIDLAGLLSEEDRQEPVNVLNGIAYDAENERLFVTGKLWPKLFEIELIPEQAP